MLLFYYAHALLRNGRYANDRNTSARNVQLYYIWKTKAKFANGHCNYRVTIHLLKQGRLLCEQVQVTVKGV